MRLFVALRLPEAVLAPLAETATRLRSRMPPARWLPPDNLHLTLRFIGETEPNLVHGLGVRLARDFAAHAPFRLRLAGGGCFPPRGPARVAWVGFEPAPTLESLQARVAATVVGHLELDPERRAFHPHLTLARPRRPWPRRAADLWSETFAGPQGPAFEVSEGHLMRSHLGRSGARHESLGAYRLGGETVGGV